MKKRNILSNIAKVMAGSLLAATVLTAISPAMAAYADEAKKPFPDREATGSITVTMKGTYIDSTETDPAKQEKEVDLEGGSLDLYQIATVEVENGFRFELVPALQGDASLNSYLDQEYLEAKEPRYFIKEEITEDEFKLLADTLDGKSLSDPKSAEVGGDGAKAKNEAYFGGLELGLYLVKQKETGKIVLDGKELDSYEAITSFLVTVPYYYKNDKGEWVTEYDVTATPKTALNAKGKLTPCQADPPVQKFVTGDGAPEVSTFNIIMSRGEYPYPMPGEGKNDSLTEMVLPVSTSKIGNEIRSEEVEYGIINFEEIGRYTYTIYEDRDNLPTGFKKETADPTVYTVTYVVNADSKQGLVVSEMIIANSKTNETKTIKLNTKFAGPDVFVFKFTNPYEAEEEETTPEPTTRRKVPENTPRDRDSTPPTPTGGEEPTVAGAYREPEGEVLGAARVPQAVLGASRLPQTGQLWWPVPILMICGIALMAGGLVKRRSDE